MLLLLQVAGCAGQAQPDAAEACDTNSCQSTPFVIGAGDVLHISVWKDPNLDRIVTVRPDGKVSFPLLNDVQAAGQTSLQLQKSISDKLKQYMDAPEVSVVVQEVHSYAVSVLGEVKKPGHYELKTGVTVLDVLAEAGGVTEFAKTSKIAILRFDGTKWRRIPFDYDDAIEGGGDQRALYVRSGDVVVVP